LQQFAAAISFGFSRAQIDPQVGPIDDAAGSSILDPAVKAAMKAQLPDGRDEKVARNSYEANRRFAAVRF
jgi:hypothetical protein